MNPLRHLNLKTERFSRRSASILRGGIGILVIIGTLFSLSLGALIVPASAAEGIATGSISGSVTDPQGGVVARADLKLLNSANSLSRETKTNNEGYYEFRSIEVGNYRLTVDAPGFAEVNQRISVLPAQATTANIQLLKLAGQTQEVRVVASEPAALTPDPSQRILIHGDVLEANPGRPGAPISIPGLSIETASGGIKAPQYFAPGVAVAVTLRGI